MSEVEVLGETREMVVRRQVDRESNERALAVMDPSILDTLFASRDPQAIVQRIANVSDVLMDAVRQRDLAQKFGDSKSEFLNIEAWQFLGSMLGMTTVGVSSRPLPDGSGWEATAELRHVATGRVLGSRDAMCQRTEPGMVKRRPPDNTIRQMAQIRAARAATRSVLGFVPKIGGFEITDPDAPATPAQKGMLHQLARDRGLTDAEKHEIAGVESFNDLNRNQAAELIDLWDASSTQEAGDEGPGGGGPGSGGETTAKVIGTSGPLPSGAPTKEEIAAAAATLGVSRAVLLKNVKGLVDAGELPGPSPSSSEAITRVQLDAMLEGRSPVS